MSAAQPLLLLVCMMVALCLPGYGLSSLMLINWWPVSLVLTVSCDHEGVWGCGWGLAGCETGLGKEGKEDPPCLSLCEEQGKVLVPQSQVRGLWLGQ